MPQGRVDPSPAKWALGPMGERLTLDKLPPPGTHRWVIRRKAEVVCAIQGGLLTSAEAIKRYNISPDELEAWGRSVERHGMRGLRSTRIQHYRHREKLFPPS